MTALPVKLKTDTIVECVFEARFGVGHQSMADFLPGMLFERLQAHFTNSVPLPFAQVPEAIREHDPNLRYQPTHALEGPDSRLMIGKRAVAVSFPKPYLGWKVVQPRIMDYVGNVLNTKLTGQPERFSLKYTNLLTHGRSEFDLTQLKLVLDLDGFKQRHQGTVIRAEIERNGCVTVVDIVSGAAVAFNTPTGPTNLGVGVILSVDAIRDGPFADFSNELPALLEIAHTTEKEVFFGLLSDSTLQKLGPIYPTEH